jgi:hypothetical protein
MGEFVEEMMALINTALLNESRSIGQEIEMDLIERLSIPVQAINLGNSTGARRASKVQRSQPGEYPRMDTGELADSIGHDVIPNGDGPDTVLIIVYTTDPKARRLEGPMKRLLIGHTFERWVPEVVNRFAAIRI